MIKVSDEKRAEIKKKKIANANRILGVTKGKEPTIDPLDYKVSIIKALNQYNLDYDTKTKKQWLLDHFKSDKTKQLLIKNYAGCITALGSLARMIDVGLPIQDCDKEKLMNFDFSNMVEDVVDEPIAQKPNIQDRLAEIFCDHLTEFDVSLDAFILKKTPFDAPSYLKSNNVIPLHAKKLGEHYTPLIVELKMVYDKKDEQIEEGYSFLSRIELRRLIDFVGSMVSSCEQHVVSSKVSRKPRTKKEKSPSLIVKGVKYLKDFMSIKSASPVDMVDSKEIWTFNSRYRTLQVYRADEYGKLSVKGTTIIGYDVGLSNQKTIRKPEMLNEFLSLTRAKMRDEFKKIKATEKPVNGRLNENTIILKVIK